MPRRGEVWWLRLDPTEGSEIAKTRPCVVLTADVLNERRRTVVVVPLRVLRLPAPRYWFLSSAVAEWQWRLRIRSARWRSIGWEGRMGELSAAHLEALERGVRVILDLA